MPNHYSALKRARQTERRTAVNRKNKGAFRASLRNARSILAAGSREKSQAVVPPTLSSIDKAVQKGLIHKNTASRLKSRLMARLNATTPAASA
ncbi:MAG: 30S ribosomal protein S20 [Acidobacteria bacterium]|nr:30S ribosomal protein S20 [Acidobacteriota bacterium]